MKFKLRNFKYLCVLIFTRKEKWVSLLLGENTVCVQKFINQIKTDTVLKIAVQQVVKYNNINQCLGNFIWCYTVYYNN